MIREAFLPGMRTFLSLNLLWMPYAVKYRPTSNMPLEQTAGISFLFTLVSALGHLVFPWCHEHIRILVNLTILLSNCCKFMYCLQTHFVSFICRINLVSIINRSSSNDVSIAEIELHDLPHFSHLSITSGVSENMAFVETIIFWILSHGSILSCSFSLLIKDFFEVIQVFSLGLKLFFVVAPL